MAGSGRRGVRVKCDARRWLYCGWLLAVDATGRSELSVGAVFSVLDSIAELSRGLWPCNVVGDVKWLSGELTSRAASQPASQLA